MVGMHTMFQTEKYQSKFNLYSIGYFIQLVLNALFIISLVFYFKSLIIPLYLIEVFNWDLAKVLFVYILLSLLAVYFVITLIMFINSVKQVDKSTVNKVTKNGIIVLPLLFLFLFQLAIIFPIVFTDSKNLPPVHFSNSKFEELKDKNVEVLNNYSYQKNCFGKVVNLERTAFFSEGDTETNDITIECYYRQSDKPHIFKKFERLSSNYFEGNKIEKDNYVLYSDNNDDVISYTLKIEDDQEYFVSSFFAYGNKGLCNYSKQQFVSDSLLNYEMCKN